MNVFARSLLPLTLCFPMLLPDSRAGESAPLSMDPVQVTATRLPWSRDRIPVSSTLITREQILLTRPASMVDLLQRIPGVHASSSGGVTSVYLRGADPNHTVVLVDGVKVNDPNNSRGGSYDFSNLDVMSIHSIEVVRGALSYVYGSDAMAGVIRISTLPGRSEPDFSVTAGAGSHGYEHASVQLRKALEHIQLSMQTTFTDSGHPQSGSQARNRQISSGLMAALAENTTLDLRLRYSATDRENFPDDSGGPRLAVLRTTDQRENHELAVGLHLNHVSSEMLEHSIAFNYLRSTEDLHSPGIAPGVRDPFGIPPNNSDTTLQRSTLTTSSTMTFSNNATLVAGLEAWNETGNGDSEIFAGMVPVSTDFDKERDMFALFLEAGSSINDQLDLLAGVRRDDPEGFSPETSSHIGVAYTLPAGITRLHASWSEGFKLPGFFSLAHPIVGNPALKPETSKTLELGMTTTFGNGAGQLDISLFGSRYHDLIDFDEGPPPLLVNRSHVDIRGMELDFGLDWSDRVHTRTWAGWTDTDIKGTDEELRNRPEWEGGMSVDWQYNESNHLFLSVKYTGEIADSSVPTGDVHLDSWLKVDLGIDRKLARNATLSLSVDNLLDRDSINAHI
jgi:outer membrane cobalamin receptor